MVDVGEVRVLVSHDDVLMRVRVRLRAVPGKVVFVLVVRVM